MNVNFQIEKEDYIIFKQKVGDRQASAILRNFIRSYGENETFSEKKIRKELEVLEPEYNKLHSKYYKLKARLEAIEQKRKEEELERLKQEQSEQKKIQDIAQETAKANLSEMV